LVPKNRLLSAQRFLIRIVSILQTGSMWASQIERWAIEVRVGF
jgi:hypothetical protein